MIVMVGSGVGLEDNEDCMCQQQQQQQQSCRRHEPETEVDICAAEHRLDIHASQIKIATRSRGNVKRTLAEFTHAFGERNAESIPGGLPWEDYPCEITLGRLPCIDYDSILGWFDSGLPPPRPPRTFVSCKDCPHQCRHRSQYQFRYPSRSRCP